MICIIRLRTHIDSKDNLVNISNCLHVIPLHKSAIASKDRFKAEDVANQLRGNGFQPTVVATSQRSNLNSETWYAASAGTYSSKTDANSQLAKIQSIGMPKHM
ncbi:SPOR domain-containing protein [Actinotignum urinale]|uniref:SPOR domain-containing protein n=1 Tax=Actinotignum urinale TaxID=190146 RepID=UPI000C80A1B4